MEKYSKFKDPLTGINPFLEPKYKKVTPLTIIMALFRLPIYFAYLLGLPVIGFLISIKRKDNNSPKGIIFCNSITEFDKDILKKALGIDSSKFTKSKNHLIFPEGTNSNNMAVLKYDKTGADWSVGLKYSNECIYLYGNRLLWLIRFLGNFNTVEVRAIKGSDIASAAGLPLSNLTKNDKICFLELVNKSLK